MGSGEPFAVNPTLKAVLWMSGALASFTTMAVAARIVSGELTTIQLLFFRTTIALFVLWIVFAVTGRRSLKVREPGIHLLRHVAHFGGQFGWFFGIAMIPLAEVFALEFTVPIWAALLAPFLIGERITAVRWLTVVLGFVGVLIVLRPGLAVVHPAAFAVLAGAVCYAVSHTLTKRLAAHDHPLLILLYMNLVQWPLAAVPVLFDWHMPSASMWPCLFAVGVTALTAHYCMSRALALGDATVVIPMDFLRLPLVAVLGWLLYSEQLDLFVLLGAAVMFSGNYINIRHELRRVV